MKIKLQEAKGYQLREFATKVLGLDVKGTESLEKVRAKIAAAYDGDEIEVSEPETVTAPVRVIPTPGASDSDEYSDANANRKVTILIQAHNGPGGDQPVFAGVNGKGIWIPRGEPVEVAQKFVEVLENAKEDKYDMLPEGGINPTPRKVPVYPFQRIA